MGSPNATNNPPYRSDYHIPGYALTNLRGGYKVWERAGRAFDVTVDLDNVFNEHYREVYSQQELVAPGFGAEVGARLTF
jgi:outer membrane receptor protein involved in Fe transport